MTVVALLPLIVLAVGLVAVVVAGGRAAEELGLLRMELQRARQLRPALVEVADRAALARAAAARLQQHRR